MQSAFENRSLSGRHGTTVLSQKPIRRVILAVVMCTVFFSGQYAPLVPYCDGTVSYQHPQMGLGQKSTYLEYLLDTHIIVLWNYTVDSHGVIKTVPGSVLYRAGGGQTAQDEIHIRADLLGNIDSDPVAMLITYSANTSSGYFADYSIRVSYYLQSGQCEIENGTLSGRSGILHLFLDSAPKSAFVISELADLSTSARLTDANYTDLVLGEAQKCFQYACQFRHIVDGNVTHRRYYDKDTHVLLGASGGISDFVLLGLGNISYAVGTLTLVDTNLDLGAPVSAPAPAVPAVVGIAAFGAFGIMYVSLYRAQRYKKPHKRPRKRRGRKSSRQSDQGWMLG